MAKKSSKDMSPRIVNRRAHFDFEITDKLEVGIELRGTEVKSIRNGQVSLAEGFASVDPRSKQLMLLNVEIAPYPHAGENQHEPKRARRLLAHRRQINDLMGQTTLKGVTLVPMAMYFKDGRVKLEIGVGTGKRQVDKRQDIKKREADREIRRGMTRKVL